MVPATVEGKDGKTVTYQDRAIDVHHKHILSHFFPWELAQVRDTGSVAVLPKLLMRSVVASSLLFPSGVLLFMFTFGPAQDDDASIVTKLLSPLGVIMMSAGGAWLWFSVTRLMKAREAVALKIPLDEVDVQVDMYRPFLAEVPAQDEQRVAAATPSSGSSPKHQRPGPWILGKEIPQDVLRKDSDQSTAPTLPC